MRKTQYLMSSFDDITTKEENTMIQFILRHPDGREVKVSRESNEHILTLDNQGFELVNVIGEPEEVLRRRNNDNFISFSKLINPDKEAYEMEVRGEDCE